MVLGLLALAGLALMPRHTQAAPLLAGNLITNPGFEGAFLAQDGKTSVGQGWTAWWIPRPEGQPDWSYNHPDFIASTPCGSVCDHRIHSGSNAQRIFQYFGTYVAGLYQRVDVTPGADVRATAFGQSWSSQTEQPQNVSNGGTRMHLRVGVDPLGGTNPYDPRIVWSEEADALDSWQQFSVYARAQSSQVTVFLYAAPDDARRKNEVYWDDVVLEALSGDPAATAQATYPTATPLPAAPPPPTPVSVALGQNLLVDGSFEGKLYIPCSRYDTVPWQHISCEGLNYKERIDGQRVYLMWNTVQVPVGWKGWWYPPNKNHAGDPNFYSDHPNNCYSDAPEGCIAWHNPEYRDTKGVTLGPSRIRSGSNSQKYFTFWSVHQAGVLQTVAVPPGSTVRFSAWMHAWSTDQDGREEFPDSYFSSGQSSMHMKVGIDPCGGENPWSPNVVWGPEQDSYDQFGYYEVRTTAQCDKVTVFTHSMPEKAMKHNDVYVDDAELVVIDASGVVQPAPVQPQPAAVNSVPASSVVNAAPAPTALPRPDGAMMHVVKAGDTVFALAFQYDVPMDQILQLNGLTKDSIIRVGQELVISAPPPAAATPAVENAAPAPMATSLPATAVVMVEPSGKTQLCVRAFEDQNADGVLSRSEALLKDTSFQVSDRSGQAIVSYTSDGMSEPHCFTRLTPGEYLVSVKPASGAQPTSDQRWSVVLDKGTTATVNFGSRLTTKNVASSSGAEGAIGLALAAVVLGGIGVMIYRQRKGTAEIG